MVPSATPAARAISDTFALKYPFCANTSIAARRMRSRLVCGREISADRAMNECSFTSERAVKCRSHVAYKRRVALDMHSAVDDVHHRRTIERRTHRIDVQMQMRRDDAQLQNHRAFGAGEPQQHALRFAIHAHEALRLV